MSHCKLSLELFADLLRDIIFTGYSDVEYVLENFREKQLLSSEHTTDITLVLRVKHIQTVFLHWAKLQQGNHDFSKVLSQATHSVLHYRDTERLPDNYTETKAILQAITGDFIDEVEEESFIYFSVIASTFCVLK